MNNQTFSIKTLSTIKVVVLALVLGLGISYAQAVWTGPLASPPNCTAGNPGCDAPINVSATAQTKTGDFTAGGLTLGRLFASSSFISPSGTSTKALHLTSGYAGFTDINNLWRWYVLENGNTRQSGTISIGGGSPAIGKVLTATNSSGDATWQAGVRPTVTYVDNAINLTGGGSYTLPANAYAIQGSYHAGAAGRQDAYVDYFFNGNTPPRRIGGLLDNTNDGGGAITAWIPFTIFIPLGKTSVTFDFIGPISNFVIHQLITT